MKSALAVFLFFSLIFCALALALEPPSKQELEEYQRDGSLGQRIANARALENDRVSPNLTARLKNKLNRLRLEMQGLAPEEIDGIMAPPPAWQGMPTSGTVKIIALLIAFNDYSPSNTAESIQSKLFGDGQGGTPYESLRNYYRRSSYNQLEIQGNVVGWYTTPYARSSVPQTTTGRENLIKEALNYYNGLGHDFTQYDNDGDGTIDYLIVIWTGPDNGWANFWWGYMTNFTDSSYKLDGKRLDTYSWQWEARPYPSTFVPKVVIHETGHALGLPDYYDYDESVGPDGGVGGLDMMDANWGDHNCFSKFLLDWINPVAYNAGTGRVTLDASGSSKENNALIVMPNAIQGDQFYEFFMIQNRYKVGNDTPYPVDGLLIWHVDSTLNSFGTDFVYDNSYTSHKLLRLMEADGLEEIEQGGGANAGDYYVSGKTFAPTTIPNSNRYDGTITDVVVSSISASGNPMSFDLSLPASGPEMNVKQGSVAIPDNTGSYNFGNVSLGSNRDATFTVENTGSSALNLTGVPMVSISGAHSGDFVVTVNPTTPVSAGGSTTFMIRFTPGGLGVRSGTVSIVNDDPDENPFNFALSGNGQDNARISVSPLTKNFGSVNVGSTSSEQTFTVSNTGGELLIIGTLLITGTDDPPQFSIRNDMCSGQTVSPSLNCTVGVVFSPTSSGTKDASLSIPSNDPDTATLNIPLTGTGIATSMIGYSPTSFTFTAIQGGSNPPSQTLNILNSGGGTLNWSVTDDAKWLSINPSRGTNSGTVTVSVNITKLSVSIYNTTITITATGATNSPVNIPVTLTVSAPDLIEMSVSSPPTTATAGSSFTVTDTINNQGNASAGPSTTRYYLSTDSIKSSKDKLLIGGRPVPALEPGATSTGQVTLVFPSKTAPGTYYLLACADDMGAVPESNEANNCAASSTTVQITR